MNFFSYNLRTDESEHLSVILDLTKSFVTEETIILRHICGNCSSSIAYHTDIDEKAFKL